MAGGGAGDGRGNAGGIAQGGGGTDPGGGRGLRPGHCGGHGAACAEETTKAAFSTPGSGYGHPGASADAISGGLGHRGPAFGLVRFQIELSRRIGASPLVLDSRAHGSFLPWTRRTLRIHSKRYSLAPKYKR